MKKNEYAYGIDFGTTNSTITAINKSGEPIRLEIDKDAENKAVMRSVIYINNRYEFTYGQKAIATYVKDIADGRVAKRKSIFTGKYIKISSPADAGGFKKDQIVPEIIEIEEGDGGRLIQALKSVLSSKFISDLRIFEKEYSIEELVSFFLKEMKNRAEVEDENKLKLQDLEKTIKEKDEKLDDFRQKELELREKSRKLEDKEKDLEVETQRRVDEVSKKVEQQVAQRLTDEFHSREMEDKKKIADMTKQIEDLKRTSQQGSMQTQGEVGELELEKILRELFPTDEIVEVKKGETGGDVRQFVRTQRGTECGLVLWERKRTKSWDEKWVSKLKEDMRRDKALLGVIVSEILPKDQRREIGERNGVWVTTANFVEPIAKLLRHNLYDVAKNKAIKLNKQSKAEDLYDFVTSRDFVSQVERMAGIYFDMRSQITKERVVAEKQWKQREMQVDGLLKGISGIYGGMQLIAGTALPQVKSLEAPEETE